MLPDINWRENVVAIEMSLHFSRTDEWDVFGPPENIGYFLDCPPAFYWNTDVFGSHSSGVVLCFPFLLHFTSNPGRL